MYNFNLTTRKTGAIAPVIDEEWEESIDFLYGRMIGMENCGGHINED